MDALNGCGKFNTINQNVHAQPNSLLIEPWEQAQCTDPSKSPHFLVVINALDEIDGMGEFLHDLLDVINKKHLVGVKFFVTS